jgi:hypothetical protein
VGGPFPDSEKIRFKKVEIIERESFGDFEKLQILNSLACHRT